MDKLSLRGDLETEKHRLLRGEKVQGKCMSGGSPHREREGYFWSLNFGVFLSVHPAPLWSHVELSVRQGVHSSQEVRFSIELLFLSNRSRATIRVISEMLKMRTRRRYLMGQLNKAK